MRQYEELPEEVPSHLDARLWYALLLYRSGFLAKTLDHLHYIYEREPLSPLVVAWLADVTFSHLQSRWAHRSSGTPEELAFVVEAIFDPAFREVMRKFGIDDVWRERGAGFRCSTIAGGRLDCSKFPEEVHPDFARSWTCIVAAPC